MLVVVHFHNGTGGGVLSVIRNVLKYKQHPQIENHVIYTINKDILKNYDLPFLEGAASEQIFYYSANWNFYYTCIQLAKLLPDNKAVIVAHDWLELGMVSNLGLKNPVVQFVHGDYDYYYSLAKKNEAGVDGFICISPVIYTNLVRILPSRKNAIHQLFFPIPEIARAVFSDDSINVFYAVRDLEDENKNFALLPTIDSILNRQRIHVHWTIVGKVNTNSETYKKLCLLKKYNHYQYLTNERLIALLSEMNMFVLPSHKEGFPVSLVEAMKAGLVPLVTNWNNATSDLLVNGENGFYLAPEDSNGYAEKIKYFIENRNRFYTFSEKASAKATSLFHPCENSKRIEKVLILCSLRNDIVREPKKVYGSRLDQKWMPNSFVFSIRKFSKILKRLHCSNITLK